MYESKDVMVSHPAHYQSETGLEVIDVIEALKLLILEMYSNICAVGKIRTAYRT